MENLKSFLKQLRDRPNPKPLFSSNPATALNAQSPTPQDKK
jgi:hypothetical protein